MTGNQQTDLKDLGAVTDSRDSNPSSNGLSHHATFYLNSAYAKLGWSMTTADVNHDGVEDVLIGAPGFEGFGCVFVVFGVPDVFIEAGDHDLVSKLGTQINVQFLNLQIRPWIDTITAF